MSDSYCDHGIRYAVIAREIHEPVAWCHSLRHRHTWRWLWHAVRGADYCGDHYCGCYMMNPWSNE